MIMVQLLLISNDLTKDQQFRSTTSTIYFEMALWKNSIKSACGQMGPDNFII